MSNGADYAWTHPSPASLKAAGVTFVMRYLAPDKTKALTAAEAKSLAAAGIWTGVVWESTADRMLAGKAAGAADAKAAAAQATACGMPAGRPIYFAADFDATEAQQAAINSYLDGAASVLGAARVGIYGGFWPVKRALDAGRAAWAWQTIAWSGGQWDPRAHIRQGAQRTIGGVSCDLNTSQTADFGQWMPGGKTPEVTPVPDLTQQIAADTAAVRADLGKITSLTDKTAAGKGVTHPASWYLAHIHYDAVLLNTKLDALAATVKTLAGLVGSGVDTAAVVTAVEDAIAAAVVHVDVDVSGPTEP